MSRADKDFLWDEYRRLICEDDDRLADPVCYWLWCHDFEDAEAVGALWGKLSAPGVLTTRGQERLLGMSGPVPWDLKAALYERLIADSRWHEWIHGSIFCGAFEFLGQVDPTAAQQVRGKLESREDIPGDAELLELLERLVEMELLGVTNWRTGGLPSGQYRS